MVSLRGGTIRGVLPELEERTDGRVEIPDGVMDVWYFFHGPTDEEMVGVLRRNDVDYVMVPTGSRLGGREQSRLGGHEQSRLYERLEAMPLFIEVDAPGQRYALFAVDHRKLERFG